MAFALNPNILKAVLSPFLLDVLRLARQSARYPKYRALLQSNLEWKNRYSGQLVYVVANGPSVSLIDRNILKNQKVIVMNSFHRAEWQHEVHPVAHCIGEPPDSGAWHDFTETIVGTNSDSYWFNIIAYSEVNRLVENKKLNYIFAAREPSIWGRRPIELHKFALGYQTTAQMAIQVALYMGFKEIRLLGFDHDWLASPQYSRHFFSDELQPDDKLGTHSYYDLIRFSLRMWEGYFALDRASRMHSAKIINMTAGSYLDVFPRAPCQ